MFSLGHTRSDLYVVITKNSYCSSPVRPSRVLCGRRRATCLGRSVPRLGGLNPAKRGLTCTCYSVLDVSDSATSSIMLAGQIASALAWTAVAWIGYQLVLQSGNGEPGARECETCGGTGVVDCFCTRWSDGDSRGCGTCGGSLKMACSSCGGGGTAVPILGKVYIKDEKDYRL